MKAKKIIGWSLLIITVISALAGITLGLMIKCGNTLFVSLLIVIGGTLVLALLTAALSWALEAVLE